MAMTMQQLEAELFGLDIESRAKLAEKLILSIDAPSEEENLQLWVAEAELLEAARYYEQRVQGLGHALIEDVEQATLELSENPLACPTIGTSPDPSFSPPPGSFRSSPLNRKLDRVRTGAAPVRRCVCPPAKSHFSTNAPRCST